MPNDAITPFTLAVPKADLDDEVATVKRKEESHD
jgi:hypothetical protein